MWKLQWIVKTLQLRISTYLYVPLGNELRPYIIFSYSSIFRHTFGTLKWQKDPTPLYSPWPRRLKKSEAKKLYNARSKKGAIIGLQL